MNRYKETDAELAARLARCLKRAVHIARIPTSALTKLDVEDREHLARVADEALQRTTTDPQNQAQ